MAKSSARKSKSKEPVQDLTLWYTDLTSLDPSLKNETWASQYLFYMKRSGVTVRFLDPVKARTYRETDNLNLDAAPYKAMVDPITPMGDGGKAEYFGSDWKANPIYIHLKNIVKAEIEKTGKQIEINLTDKYAKTRKMNENYRILYREAFRKLINDLAKEMGIPGVTENQDPYKWVDNVFSDKEDNQKQSDVIDKYIDLIKTQITDSQDFALYNELIYKGDYELAFELGVKYYMETLNKWSERWADEIIDDLMHFNKACGEWYTDLTNGRPVVERFFPERLNVSKFTRKDGEDIVHYYIEYDIIFADFIRQIGKNLSPQKLKEVFELNKAQGGSHGIEWQDSYWDFSRTNYSRDNATIRIGKAACLTTDMEVQIEDTNSGYPLYTKADLSWAPMEGDENKKRIEKRYNVWRWWYYIPPTMSTINAANWEWQCEFIFELQKHQDQQRYGDNGRFSKSPLVIYDNSSQATFTDVVQTYMPKIHHCWHNFQNCLVNDFDAVIFAQDFVGGLMAAVDESNKINAGDPNKPTGGNGRDAYMAQWKMIQQSGKGFLNMTDSKTGQLMIDPSKLMVHIKNEYVEKAEKWLALILIQYDLMIKSLAFSPITAGEEVKPRTPVAALEQNLKAADSSKFFIQKGYEVFYKMYAERFIRFILDIAGEAKKQGYTKRFDEFMNQVGYANGLALEGLADVTPEDVGMSVDYVDNTAKKEFIMNLAIEYVKTKELSEDFLYLIMGCDNWKYSFVLMRLGIKQRRKENEKLQQQQHQNIMEQKEADLQIAMALQTAKDTGKDQNILTEGKVKDMINLSLNNAKMQAQGALKQQTDALRKSENLQKTNLDMIKDDNKARHDKELEAIASRDRD